MSSASQQAPMWAPSAEELERFEMTSFMRWAGERRGGRFADYDELWRWSVTEVEDFWAAVWEFCGVRASKPYERVLSSHKMPGARWFEGAELNYAENVLRGPASAIGQSSASGRSATTGRDPGEVAVLHASELRDLEQLSAGELAARVAACAAGLRALGVQRGDRVVAYMPNIPETLIALLAVASIGAIFSSAAPEFGARAVIDRFAQIEPKVLLAVDGYRHGGKDFDRMAVVEKVLAELPTVEHAVLLGYLTGDNFDGAAVGGGRGGVRSVITWDQLLDLDPPAPGA
jgi:acetoacetyl-CoA synthetase